MSVDIQWETLTAGPDGAHLAESIRAFIHDKFQQVPLPRFVRSVQVHSFDFGSVPPEIQLKDICDPLPDFYEEDEEDEEDNEDVQHDDVDVDGNKDLELNSNSQARSASPPNQSRVGSTSDACQRNSSVDSQIQGENHAATQYRRTNLVETGHTVAPRDSLGPAGQPLSPAFFPAASGIPGGISNLTYFHLPLGAGLSGTATPLAAVAGAHFHKDWHENVSERGRSSPSGAAQQAPVSGNSLTPPSTADPSSRPPSQHYHQSHDSGEAISTAGRQDRSDARVPPAASHRAFERNPQDVQIVAHVRYSGDLRLSLTAEILLDYPMPSFVGIPLKLNITGLTFDGVAVLAHIKKRAHFCFLSPEDADALVGRQDDLHDGTKDDTPQPVGGLLEEIRVESEIGDKDNGRQVLKNVGKVERFVLEQVRRIFEDEFVYPSFWTFLL